MEIAVRTAVFALGTWPALLSAATCRVILKRRWHFQDLAKRRRSIGLRPSQCKDLRSSIFERRQPSRHRRNEYGLHDAQAGGKYDEQQDLARIPMQFGELPKPESEFTAYFAHVAPDQRNMRLDLQKARAWGCI